MAKEDKFLGEMLNDDELDSVTGGSKQELQELYDAIAGNSFLSGYLKKSTRDSIDPEEIARVLDEKLNIGFLYAPLDRENAYISVTGVNIQHSEIVEACATFRSSKNQIISSARARAMRRH